MPASPIHSVLETSLYARDLEATAPFYDDVLGLERTSAEPGRHVFFRCGRQMVLLFNPAATASDDALAHGAEGAGHVAFAVDDGALADWRERLADAGVEVEAEKEGAPDARSLHVRDPAGNSVELASADLWGTAGRADRLEQVRPVLGVEPSTTDDPVERFQHETLRPVLKLLNPTILRLVAARLRRYGVDFGGMARADRLDRLRNLVKEDGRLKQTLLGMVAGHLTGDELDVYLDHEAEVRRRCVPMLLARVQDQVDEVAALVART
jgi:catechol 2,3-dioxygenase-like lactoylglutathione lyase family enzyme